MTTAIENQDPTQQPQAPGGAAGSAMGGRAAARRPRECRRSACSGAGASPGGGAAGLRDGRRAAASPVEALPQTQAHGGQGTGPFGTNSAVDIRDDDRRAVGNGQSEELHQRRDGQLERRPQADAQGYSGPSSVTGSGGGVAGGQQSYDPSKFGVPDIQGNVYTGGAAFNDPNAGNIYGVINNQINNRANQAAPQLGSSTNYGGAQLGNQMMANAATLITAGDSQLANAQNSQINALAQIASGQGPSVATTQAAQQRDANIAASMSMLGSQRGSSAALGIRGAQDAAATANQQAAASGALGRAQEATAAQQQLTGALSGARGQGQATSTTQAQLQQQALLANQSQFNAATQNQAGLTQQAGLASAQNQNQFDLANQQAQLQQSQLNNQQYQAGESAYMAQNQQDMASNQAYQSMLEQEELQKYGLDKNPSGSSSSKWAFKPAALRCPASPPSRCSPTSARRTGSPTAPRPFAAFSKRSNARVSARAGACLPTSGPSPRRGPRSEHRRRAALRVRNGFRLPRTRLRVLELGPRAVVFCRAARRGAVRRALAPRRPHQSACGASVPTARSSRRTSKGTASAGAGVVVAQSEDREDCRRYSMGIATVCQAAHPRPAASA